MRIRIHRNDNVTDIKNIMNVCYSTTRKKDVFQTDKLSFIKKHVKDEGRILVVKKSRLTIAYILIRFPELSKDNLGYDLDYTIADLYNVAHIESVGVLPEYRGKGLQKQLIRKAERLFKGKYRFFLATVSPHNKYSLKNFQNSGYSIKKSVVKYGNKERYILEKSFL